MALDRHHPTVEAPACLGVVADLVTARLEALLEDEEARWWAIDPDLAEPFGALRAQLAAGGKRLRPAFCSWAFVAAGGKLDDPRIVDGSAGVELLHAFALAHDDVMDRSPSRRGQPTTHVHFARRHGDEGWSGDAGHFGEAVAILVGDLAYAYADLMMGAPDQRVAKIWQEMRVEVNIGQYLDVLAEARGDASAATARRIVELKTGRYSVVRPLQLGVAIAGGPAALADALSAYGHPVGIAFQLRDDMLGAFGDSAVTGKPVGDDLRQGKVTPLLADARARATPAQAEILAAVGSPELSDASLRAIQQVLHECGAVAAIEAEIVELTACAVTTLEATPMTPDAADALAALAHYVADRPA